MVVGSEKFALNVSIVLAVTEVTAGVVAASIDKPRELPSVIT